MKVTVGLVCFIIPGLYLMIVFTFVPFIYLDHFKDVPYNWSVIEACFLYSVKIINSHFCKLFGWLVVSFLINLAGLLCFGVGYWLTSPLTSLAMIFVYRSVCTPHDAIQVADYV